MQKTAKTFAQRLYSSNKANTAFAKLPLDVIRKLPKAENISLPANNVHDLRAIATVNDSCTSLVEYLRCFDITSSVLQKRYAITRTVYEVCEDAYKDGVKYIEIRFSPILHMREGLSLSSVMEAVVEGCVMAELNMGITARIIVCGMRQMSSAVTLQLAQIAWRYQNRGVVAFDLAGPEDGFSSKHHKEAFDLIHRKMINCTLHSGEAASWKSVLDSIRFCGAQRIGHGVRMRENAELMQYVANERIPIEVCITSNIQTKCVKSYADHPVRQFFDAGMVVVPCTDNVSVSGITLSDEYYKLQEFYGFNIPELVRCIDFGFRSAFLDLSTKKRMRAEAMFNISKLLKQHGYDTSGIFQATSHLDVGMDFPQLDSQLASHADEYNVTKYPEVFKTLIKELPKADLNCRLSGSVSLDTLWRHMQDSATKEFVRQSWQLECKTEMPVLTKEQFVQFIQPAKHTKETIDFASWIMSQLMQTKEQIESGVEDILTTAAKENVTYVELHVRPTLHTRRGLGYEQVIHIVLAKKQEMETKLGIQCGMLLYVDAVEDGHEQVSQIALLTVRYKHEISGFGMYGSVDLVPQQHKFAHVFDMLKNNQIQVSIVAAFKHAESVIDIIHDSDASRLSGGFALHNSPELMSYIANNGYAIEIAPTHTLKKFTKEAEGILGSVIRLLLDRSIRIAVCSFDMTLYPYSRSDLYMAVAQDAKLNVQELISVISAGYRYSFQPYWNKRKWFEKFYQRAVQVAQQQGIPKHCSFESSYFPTKQ